MRTELKALLTAIRNRVTLPFAKLSDWIEGHPERANAWATAAATIVAALALFGTVATYAMTVNRELAAKAGERLNQAQLEFEHLQRGEQRYQLLRSQSHDDHALDPPCLGCSPNVGSRANDGSGNPVSRLDFAVREGTSGSRFAPVFCLAPVWQTTMQTRLETRNRPIETESGEVTIQTYTIDVPYTEDRLVIPRPSVDVFGCIDCNSLRRLNHYLSIQRLLPSIANNITPEQQIRLARADIDFGHIDAALMRLSRAVQTLDSEGAGIYASLIKEDAGKSYLIAGDIDEGTRLLEESKRYWRTKRSQSQVLRLHETIAWQAQFFASKRDYQRVNVYLAEMAAAISTYNLGRAMTAVLIEEQYLSCLVILASQDGGDPYLDVPKEHLVYTPEGIWMATSQYVNAQIAKNEREALRSVFKTDDGKLIGRLEPFYSAVADDVPLAPAPELR